VVICHHGGSVRWSSTFSDFLRDAGFDNAGDLNGGIEAWARGIDRSRRELSLLKALRSASGQRRNRSVRFVALRAGRLAA
jgi:hypothetical protein